MENTYLPSDRLASGNNMEVNMMGALRKDILSLIKADGPQPNYNAVQRGARETLGNIHHNGLQCFFGPAKMGKTWTWISLICELLHENLFKVAVVAPTHHVLEDISVLINEEFQQHSSLKDKSICYIKSLGNPHALVFNRSGRPAKGTEPIFEQLGLESKVIEFMEKDKEKYEPVRRHAAGVDDGIPRTQKKMQTLKSLITEAKFNTLREIDVALLTQTDALKPYFRDVFSVDFLIIEDDYRKQIPTEDLVELVTGLQPKLTILVSTSYYMGDEERLSERVSAFNSAFAASHRALEVGDLVKRAVLWATAPEARIVGGG